MSKIQTGSFSKLFLSLVIIITLIMIMIIIITAIIIMIKLYEGNVVKWQGSGC